MVLQETWQFRVRHSSAVFGGYPTNRGPCPCGGEHVAVEIKAGRDLPGIGMDRTEWRYCARCFEVFFVGYPEGR